MRVTSPRLLAAALCALAFVFTACSGGSDGTTPGTTGEAFSLLLTANPDTGTAPLTVTFFVVPSGGQAPYRYSWDFDNDGVEDSNAPSGTHTYPSTGQGLAKVTVTDAGSQQVTASRTVIITGTTPVVPGAGLDIRFNASPQVGNVPFDAHFTAYVGGGKAPYNYAWDFEGDGVYDSFLQNPLWKYQKVGTPVGGGNYVVYPVLKVTDGRGVVGTNLDDNDGNGLPDFRLAINALPQGGGMVVAATANPIAGQAPLRVEFTGAVTGGSGNYEFKWFYGDTQFSDFSASSIALHTYLNAGTYMAYVRAHDKSSDQTVDSTPLAIQVTLEQDFSLNITTDINSGQVPFVVNCTANPVNGTEPIQYQWDVFNDDALDPAPSVSTPPTLDGSAVVTPNFSFRKNPTIHFANTASAPTGQNFNYVLRCTALDASGNTTVSNLLRVTASPNTTYPYYKAHRAEVGFRTFFPAFRDPTASANAQFEAITPATWRARANAAVCTHPTGIAYIIGGEYLDENGNFQSLVNRGDSMYMYVPEASGTGTGETNIGKFDTGAQGGSLIRLNDNTAPAFPNTPVAGGPLTGYDAPGMDTIVPPVLDPNQPPASAPPTPTSRSAPFTIVGSAAAVFMHEQPETNPAGEYPHQPPVPGSVDSDVIGYPHLYAYPDSPTTGWNLDAPPFDMNGIGSPVIYVLGGRTGATTPTDLIQKYQVYGFGSEDLIPWSNTFAFQTTGNQVDIWSPYFLRPDTDQFPGSGSNFDPQIQDRRAGSQESVDLPRLPKAVYGLMAVRIESGVDGANPVFPNGPFRSIFIFGGIDENGSVLDEMRWWNVNETVEQGNNSGDPGLFSLVEPGMPSARAYGQAVFIPSGGMRIALVGGFDKNGVPLDTVDVFSFDDFLNPQAGSWQTFAGSLPEALEACGAGYNDRYEPAEAWVLAFAGWTGERFSFHTYNARLGSPGSVVVSQAPLPIPRSHIGSGQSGAAVGSLGASFNRYYLCGGTDENGADSIIEVLSLP